MMRKHLSLFILTVNFFILAAAQDKDYLDSIGSYQKKYVKNHEVVIGKDKEYMHFFPASETYRITARFERIYEAPWFKMPTSGTAFQVHRVYGILHFALHDTTLKLHIYQSQDLMGTKEYASHLFIPFTDKTCGNESYENGRYIELTIEDIESENFVIDFNKAYNPYCAYVTNRYSCPIPPKENDLPVAIRAGEMKYGKTH